MKRSPRKWSAMRYSSFLGMTSYVYPPPSTDSLLHHINIPLSLFFLAIIPLDSNRCDCWYSQSHVTRRIKQDGLANFAFAPGTLPPIIAAFVPEKKGGPGQARIFKYPAIEQPVAGIFSILRCVFFFPRTSHPFRSVPSTPKGKTLWKAQTAKLDWAPGASGLLVAAKTDVDKSGKSYYGSTTLHFLSPNAAVDVTLSLGTSPTTTNSLLLSKIGLDLTHKFMFR